MNFRANFFGAIAQNRLHQVELLVELGRALRRTYGLIIQNSAGNAVSAALRNTRNLAQQIPEMIDVSAVTVSTTSFCLAVLQEVADALKIVQRLLKSERAGILLPPNDPLWLDLVRIIGTTPLRLSDMVPAANIAAFDNYMQHWPS